MSPAVVSEYVAHLLAKTDEDAFHSLIEEGNPSVEAVREVLPTCTNEQSKRLIEVLQDIRTDYSRETLTALCRHPYSELWVAAAEGLFYNDAEAARIILSKIQAGPDESGDVRKSELIQELLASVSLPTPESPPPPSRG